MYSGKRDGFAASTFHSKCNGQGRTLTIIKSNSHLFGGYTEQTWHNYDYNSNLIIKARNDPKSFIFSIKNDYEHLYRPFIMEPKTGVNGIIYTQPESGPIFGAGHDLYISNYCNSNSESYANLGNTYLFSFFPQGTSQANNFLAGSNRFMCEEIEVYRIY